MIIRAPKTGKLSIRIYATLQGNPQSHPVVWQPQVKKVTLGNSERKKVIRFTYVSEGSIVARQKIDLLKTYMRGST